MTGNPPTGKAADRLFSDSCRILQGTQEFIAYPSDSSICVLPCSETGSCGMHYHSAVEIVLVETGEAVYTLPERTYTVSAGQVLILPPKYAHACSCGAGTRRYAFLFEPHIFNSLRDLSVYAQRLSQAIYLEDDTALRREARELLLQVAEIFEARKPLWNSLCYSLLIRLYSALGREWALQAAQPEPVNIDSEIMNSVLSYISQHYGENIHLDDAAAFSGFSKFYFSRAFKKLPDPLPAGGRHEAADADAAAHPPGGGAIGLRQRGHLQPHLPRGLVLHALPVPQPLRQPLNKRRFCAVSAHFSCFWGLLKLFLKYPLHPGAQSGKIEKRSVICHDSSGQNRKRLGARAARRRSPDHQL